MTTITVQQRKMTAKNKKTKKQRKRNNDWKILNTFAQTLSLSRSYSLSITTDRDSIYLNYRTSDRTSQRTNKRKEKEKSEKRKIGSQQFINNNFMWQKRPFNRWTFESKIIFGLVFEKLLSNVVSSINTVGIGRFIRVLCRSTLDAGDFPCFFPSSLSFLFLSFFFISFLQFRLNRHTIPM